MRDCGALRETAGAFLTALVLNRERQDAFQEGVCTNELGRLLAETGNRVPAQIVLRRSRQIFIDRADPQGEGIASAYFAELASWIGDLDMASKWAERAWELGVSARNTRDVIRAALLQGQVALVVGEWSCADERLHHALARARAVGLVDFELPALIAIAGLDLKRGDRPRARATVTRRPGVRSPGCRDRPSICLWG